MKVKTIPSAWMRRDGRRFDCGPYMSGALEAKIRLEEIACRKDRLADLTAGHAGGIYNGPQFVRNFVDDPEHGVPFLGTSSMLRADLSDLPLLRKRDAMSAKLSYLRIDPGMTLISCSGTIGRMVYARPDMAGMWSNQDIIKVVPDPEKVRPGFVYAFLSSKFGVPMVTSGTYGAIIQHIEPEHVADVPVPRFDDLLEAKIHICIEKAAELRARHQRLLNNATNLFLASCGVEEQTPSVWNALGPELGFEARIGISRSLRACNYSPRAAHLLRQLAANVAHRSLGDVCRGGHLGTGARFKRIDCDPGLGVRLVGQRQGFWMRPEGRWISAARAPQGIFAADESVLIASSGTLGEKELYCRPIFVTGRWLEYAYTQHFLRVVSSDQEVSGAYLFALFRSEMAFRCLRSMSTGSKQQEIHRDFISGFPVPILNTSIRGNIELKVREAFRMRDQADFLEDEAISLVEHAIEELS